MSDYIFTVYICKSNHINVKFETDHFLKKSDLKKHIESVHLKMQPHVCCQYDRSFTRKNDLKIHIDYVHMKIKPHKCELCERLFSRKSDLRKHNENKHMQIRPCKCDICDRSFAQKRQHSINVHKPNKPLKL